MNRNPISGAGVQYPVPVQPANELPTRDGPGRDRPRRDSPGKDSPGRDSPGRESRGILKSSRLIALLVVLVCHLGVIALLVAESASSKVGADAKVSAGPKVRGSAKVRGIKHKKAGTSS